MTPNLYKLSNLTISEKKNLIRIEVKEDVSQGLHDRNLTCLTHDLILNIVSYLWMIYNFLTISMKYLPTFFTK